MSEVSHDKALYAIVLHQDRGRLMKTFTRLDIEDARKLIAGAAAHAKEIGVLMCIAVTDESG